MPRAEATARGHRDAQSAAQRGYESRKPKSPEIAESKTRFKVYYRGAMAFDPSKPLAHKNVAVAATLIL